MEKKATLISVAPGVAVPPQSDDAEGLRSMYSSLTPLASKVRLAAKFLFVFSLLRCFSLEGIMGLVASAGILFCAAPGSLGVAYASRCASVTASFAAVFAAMGVSVAVFVATVLPTFVANLSEVCDGDDDDVIESPGSAKLLRVGRISRALSSYVPETVYEQAPDCNATVEALSAVGPFCIVAAGFVELGVLVSAVVTAKLASRLVVQARSYGANAL